MRATVVETSLSGVRVEHLTKAFDGRVVVDHIAFEVGAGELCVLLGPSGCGKSTTLRLIAGLEEPNFGRILIDDADVVAMPPKDRRISMVFQSYALFPHLDVAENIVFGLKVRGVPKAERADRLMRVVALTGLSDYLDRKPSQLSGGQRQRVALARAIVGEQPICLMDEPLSNLDAQLRGEMRLEIRALQQRLGMTMIYVTHDQIEAMTMADRVILMKDGRIEQNGVPADLYERPATMFTARFIGAPAMNLLAPQRIDGHVDEIVVGVRAEHVRLAPPRGTDRDGVVASVEYLGADTVVAVVLADGCSVAARLPGRVGARVGDAVGLAWEDFHEHRFDVASGRRLDQPHPIAPQERVRA
ncbi:ABC transporter ATP-binding protein [Siculibacillus lacustris]|uniref:ABC transporter ATP-binding protein n=1 Tax=Siculibacillus lacustris TaxID=1549641 RepID=A0A4Q9VV02_9HYPH|nr:ABC transporter ATP-binding protein [Siculibacillus lacustris]TBW39003.1 ABC transporter ATP-binding protein [Siculibacillus lacustris]